MDTTMFKTLRWLRHKIDGIDKSPWYTRWVWYALFILVSAMAISGVVLIASRRAAAVRKRTLLVEQARVLRTRAEIARNQEETARANEMAEAAMQQRAHVEKEIERTAMQRDALLAGLSRATTLDELDSYYDRLQ